MIGSGIFLLPASLAPYGATSLLGWIFTTAGSILLGLSFAQMSRLIPRAGGPYTYTREGFGDFAGFLVAWGYWISICAGNAAIAVAFAGYLSVFFPALAENRGASALAALGAVWLLTGINAWGVREAGRLQLATTVLKLLPLIALGSLGLFSVRGDYLWHIPEGHSIGSGLASTAALTLWAFLGLESATVPADHVRDPARTIPRATLLGTLAAALVYVCSTVAVMGLVDSAELARSAFPFAEAAGRLWGPAGTALIGAGAVVACFGALNGWILLEGQIPLAAARDGLFPRSFARLSPRGTPVFGLMVSSLLVTVIVALNYTKSLVELFTLVILLSTMTCLLPYLLVTLAELMMYARQPEHYARERTGRRTVLALLAFAYALWALGGSGENTVYWGFILLMAGLPIYVWMQWHRAEGANS